GSLEADYREALQREQQLQTKVAQLKSGYLDLRRRSIQYNIYQQEVDTNRALYDGLLQRFKEIGVAGGVGVNNISIVDPADVPQKPSSPIL
ncbi:exopolysaccharide biosynthesis protein, partial [Listeria monocytogenes]|nr:exopolysaccharide biosynthesis protein [Listeria monocytogenes]